LSLFGRIRGVFSSPEVCPPEHLEGYRRISDEVYEAKVELANDTNPHVQLLLRTAEAFQVMGNALLADVLSSEGRVSSNLPEITHEQAETWFGHIPELLIAARKESVYPGSSQVSLPVILRPLEIPEQMCPLSHLAGLRRATSAMEDHVSKDIEYLRLHKEDYRATLLLYEEARTRRNTGDALIGSIMSGEYVPHETHEDAKEQYGEALRKYLLVVQGIGNSSLIENWLSPKSKLDTNDVWKVTARLAIEDLREAGEYDKTQLRLEDFWACHEVTFDERQYESTVERLLREGAIQENGYWYKVPYQPVYQVTRPRAEVHGKRILKGHEFVWDYDVSGNGHGLMTRSEFRYATERAD
jgi:hypothetical protein